MRKQLTGVMIAIFWAIQSEAGPIVQWKIEDGGNGHYYERVDLNGVTWTHARELAAASLYAGLSGHLATITSQAETDFLIGNLPVTGLGQPTEFWLGGLQNSSSPQFAEPGGGWEWITGESFLYTNWASAQPNNFFGESRPENYLSTRFDSPWAWNDLPVDGDLLSPGNNVVAGYIVEYSIRPIPEPPSIAVISLGSLFLIGYGSHRRKRSSS